MKSNCVSPEPKPASGLVPARVLFWRVSRPSLSSAFVQSGSYVLREPALPQGIPPWEEDGLHAKVWGPHFFCLVISRTLLINSAVISRPCCRMRHNGCSCLRYLSRQISSFFSKKNGNFLPSPGLAPDPRIFDPPKQIASHYAGRSFFCSTSSAAGLSGFKN